MKKGVKDWNELRRITIFIDSTKSVEQIGKVLFSRAVDLIDRPETNLLEIVPGKVKKTLRSYENAKALYGCRHMSWRELNH